MAFTAVSKNSSSFNALSKSQTAATEQTLLIGGGFELLIGGGYKLTIQPGGVSSSWTPLNKS